MARIVVVKPFGYAFEGIRVVRYELGEQDVPQEVADEALRERWALSPAPEASGEPDEAPGEPDAAPGEPDAAPGEPRKPAKRRQKRA